MLQRRGIIVRPMDGYGLPEYIRVTLGTRAQNEKVVETLSAVLREVAPGTAGAPPSSHP